MQLSISEFEVSVLFDFNDWHLYMIDADNVSLMKLIISVKLLEARPIKENVNTFKC